MTAPEDNTKDQAELDRQWLRNLAHEIKNPLGGIRGAAQLLELELGNARLREYTRVIISETDRLKDLVDRLLVPHLKSSRRRPVDIQALCEHARTLTLAQYAPGLEIECDYTANLPPLRGDTGQLMQAVLNIVLNAAQALRAQPPEAPCIVLRTRTVLSTTENPALLFVSKDDASSTELPISTLPIAISISVIDNGPGISPALREQLFLPLVTGRPDGCGLGLSLAQTFVQLHDGTIEVDSRPGHTEFCIVLPLAQPVAALFSESKV